MIVGAEPHRRRVARPRHLDGERADVARAVEEEEGLRVQDLGLVLRGVLGGQRVEVDHHGIDVVLAVLPVGSGIGVAVVDRLTRAAATK